MEQELEQLRKFHRMVDLAHQEHLKTGDYQKLGMDTQDALRACDLATYPEPDEEWRNDH